MSTDQPEQSQPEQAQPEQPQARRRRSPLVPAAVALIAGSVALGGWLGSRDAAERTPPTTATPTGAESTTDVPNTAVPTTDAGQRTDTPGSTDAGNSTAAGITTAAPDATDAEVETLDPITVGDVELTPPAPSAFRYPGPGEESWTAPLEDRDPDGPYALGDADAPVVLIIWSDFQCPFCRSWATETKPELMPFVEDGTLRMEWRDFPYLGPESSLAALGGRTAAEQDMFWEFHDALFAADHGTNAGDITEESLADIAEQAGLDRAAFSAALNTVEQQEAVLDDQDEGLALGVMGTPAFMINGMPIRGAQPTPTFVQAVEDAAAARGR